MKTVTAFLACVLAAAPAVAQQGAGTKAPANAGVARAQARPQTMRVVIDAGHGGVDKGVVSAGLAEKDTTLQLALELRTELERRGVQVILTRASDSFVSLADRVRVASEVRPDCFVSLHKLQRLPQSRKPSPFFGLFYFSPQSKPLANALSPAIKRGIGALGAAPGLEVQQQRFYVLRQTTPAVLVEVDIQGMSDPSVQTPLVRALADGTVSFLKSRPK